MLRHHSFPRASKRVILADDCLYPAMCSGVLEFGRNVWVWLPRHCVYHKVLEAHDFYVEPSFRERADRAS
jgi:hypothetical protein